MIRRCLAVQVCLMAVFVTAQQLRYDAVPTAVVRGIQCAAISGMLVALGFIARQRFRGRRWQR